MKKAAAGGVKARQQAGRAARTITSTEGFAPKGNDRNKGGEKVSQNVKWFLNDTVTRWPKDSPPTMKQPGDTSFQGTRYLNKEPRDLFRT